MNKPSELINILKIEKVGTKYQVFSSNDESIKVSEQIIVDYRILKGSSYTQEEWNKIKESIDKDELFQKAINYIDYQLRLKKEVYDHFLKKGYLEEDILEVIESLTKIGYLDDERYATLYIESKIKQQQGPLVIEYNLLGKGVPSELIKKHLDEIPKELLFNNAYELAEGILKKLEGYPAARQKETIYLKLSRTGYDYSIINQVLNSVEYSQTDENILRNEYLKLKESVLDKNKIIKKLLSKGYNYSEIKKIIDEE